MKKLKGIFDGMTEMLAPGITDTEKTVTEMMLFQSAAMKNRDRNKQQNPDNMELPFKGISIPVDLPEKTILSKTIKGKAVDKFVLPGFSKDDMDVDSGDFLKKATEKTEVNLMDIEGNSKPDSLFKL